MKKKVFALIIAVALVASLSACKGTTDRSSSKDSSSSTTAEVEKDSASDQSDKDSGKETDNNSSDKETSTDKSNEKSDKETGSSSSSGSSKSDNKASSSASSSKTNSSSNTSSSKPSSSSSNSGSSGNKPSSGSGSSSSGNTGPANKPQQHNYTTVVSSTNGDCSHKGKVTKKCSCGATITVDGNYGSHNWKDSFKDVYHEAVTKPVYAYCYVCNQCGAQFKDEQSCGEHCIFDCGGSYSYKEWVDHYETVTPAWTERVPNGKDCTICGKHSN